MSDEQTLNDVLDPIRSADTEPETLAAIARATWFNAHDGEACPDDAIPDMDRIDAFRADDATTGECEKRMGQAWSVLPTFGPWVAVPLAGRPWAVFISSMIRLHAPDARAEPSDGRSLAGDAKTVLRWCSAAAMDSARGEREIQLKFRDPSPDPRYFGSRNLSQYEWTPLADFLARVMRKPRLYPMDDPLARANVMAYHEGEALNWHFDRSEFTTTLLLQAPDAGGEFQYRSDLRTPADPNLDGVARLLDGRDPEVRSLTLAAGTLNVFKGRNTAHRTAPVIGPRERMIAVFSYYERPGVLFSEEERVGFYGRAG